jgi:hypothetical protein
VEEGAEGAMPVPGPIMITGAFRAAGIVKPCDFCTKTRSGAPGATRLASILEATPLRNRLLNLYSTFRTVK